MTTGGAGGHILNLTRIGYREKSGAGIYDASCSCGEWRHAGCNKADSRAGHRAHFDAVNAAEQEARP